MAGFDLQVEVSSAAVPAAAVIFGAASAAAARPSAYTLANVRGISASIAAAPSFLGQLATSSSKPYVATGVASASDWTRVLQWTDLDFVSARKYGAVLDGVTDDTANMITALASGKNITLDGGTAKVSSTLTPTRSLVNGTILAAAGALTNLPILKVNATTTTITSKYFGDLFLQGNDLCDGLAVNAATPYVVTKSVFERLLIKNVRDAIQITGTSANEVYANSFRDIRGWVIGRHGLTCSGACYNTFDTIEMTLVEAGYAYDISQSGGSARNLTCDGPVKLFLTSGGQVDGLTIETIHATTPVSVNALQLNGVGISAKNVLLTNIDPAKCTYAVAVFSTKCRIENYFLLGTMAPLYRFFPQGGSVGTLINAVVGTGLTGYKCEAFVTAATMQSWNFGDCPDITDKNTIGRRFIAALPTASDKLRGSELTVLGGAGVADVTSRCEKNASDAYVWNPI